MTTDTPGITTAQRLWKAIYEADVTTVNECLQLISPADDRINYYPTGLEYPAGWTLVHQAITHHGYHKRTQEIDEQYSIIIDALIRHGVNVDSVTAPDGDTPLHLAYRTLPIVQTLITNGANVNIMNALDETPLFLACQMRSNDHHEQAAIVNALLKAGADPNLNSFDGYTPLMAAAEKWRDYPVNTEVIHLLISHGAKLQIADSSGCNALDLAIETASDEGIRILLSYGIRATENTIDFIEDARARTSYDPRFRAADWESILRDLQQIALESR